MYQTDNLKSVDFEKSEKKSSGVVGGIWDHVVKFHVFRPYKLLEKIRIHFYIYILFI